MTENLFGFYCENFALLWLEKKKRTYKAFKRPFKKQCVRVNVFEYKEVGYSFNSSEYKHIKTKQQITMSIKSGNNI